MREPSKHERLAALSSLETDEFRDPKACYSEREISRVDDCLGTSVLMRACGCGDFLVELSALELYRGPLGFTYLGRLAGTVKWGDVAWKSVNIDRSAVAKDNGWDRVDSFDDILVGIPDSHYQFQMNSMRFHTLETNGYKLLSVRSVDGLDLIDGIRCKWEVDTKAKVLCSMVSQYECINWACSRPCNVVADGTVLGDCNCSGHGFCSWWNQPHCVPVNCPRSCRLVGYFSLDCDCASARVA